MMIEFENKTELLKYLDAAMTEVGTYAACKSCAASKGGGCCLPMNCEFYTEDGRYLFSYDVVKSSCSNNK